MYTLGINAAFHDSAAAIVKDGAVIAAAEDERFTHVKHGKRPVPFTVYELPFHAIHYCLEAAGIQLRDVDHVAYSFDPRQLAPQSMTSLELPLHPGSESVPDGFYTPWEPLSVLYVINAPQQLVSGVPHHLSNRWPGTAAQHFKWHFIDHHTAHAASAFFASPFEEAAVMTLDGRGERTTTSYYFGQNTQLESIAQVIMPHSLGLLYERVTSYLGFLHSSDEYKVMALASFGKPAFRREFEDIIRLDADGSYRISEITLEETFGPARERGGPYEARHYDIAHSLQAVLQDRVLALAQWLHQRTRTRNLCMAGGVALNCVMNSYLRDHGPFDAVWVQPAAGDAGTALGAAIWADYAQRRPASRSWRMDDAYLGPEYSDAEVEAALKRAKLRYRRSADIAEETADLLAAEKVVGWFQGRMEFGPRALGSRSVLASPRRAEMQDRLNEIKDREDFRPVAPAVLEEKAHEWFERTHQAPFMLFVFNVLPEKAELIPAVRHIDGTARVQTVNRAQHQRYYDVISAFERRTGVPVLVNTSFNTRGQPIVCNPQDALGCYLTSPLDALAIGSFLLEKDA